jgi:hypothetical protein
MFWATAITLTSFLNSGIFFFVKIYMFWSNEARLEEKEARHAKEKSGNIIFFCIY